MWKVDVDKFSIRKLLLVCLFVEEFNQFFENDVMLYVKIKFGFDIVRSY